MMYYWWLDGSFICFYTTTSSVHVLGCGVTANRDEIPSEHQQDMDWSLPSCLSIYYESNTAVRLQNHCREVILSFDGFINQDL